MNFGIITNYRKNNALNITQTLINELIKFGASDIYIEPEKKLKKSKHLIFCNIEKIAENSDYIFILGGDGTFINSINKIISYNKIIIPVNIGFLGFISDLKFSELAENIKMIFDGKKLFIEKHHYVEIEIDKQKYSAVNELVISHKIYPNLISIDLTVNGSFFSNVKADGIIFSSSMGSTGYSLSAGGPIVNPSLNCIIMTPLCAHSLSARPVIFSEKDIITAKLNTHKNVEPLATIDGSMQFDIPQSAEIKICCSRNSYSILRFKPDSYFERVNTKLKWNN